MFTLKLELDAGVSLEKAAMQACRLAKRLQLRIRFSHDGYQFIAEPSSTPSQLIDFAMNNKNRSMRY